MAGGGATALLAPDPSSVISPPDRAAGRHTCAARWPPSIISSFGKNLDANWASPRDGIAGYAGRAACAAVSPSRSALQAKGHKLQTAGAWSLGSNAAIAIDPKTGVLSAGADPRVEAYAWAKIVPRTEMLVAVSRPLSRMESARENCAHRG